MRRVRDEQGALSPAFLMFFVAVVLGTFLFLQLAHATILKAETHTAADSAALAGAEEMTGNLHLGHILGNGNDIQLGDACQAAAEYAEHNGAELRDCEIDDNRSRGQFAIIVTVRGQNGPMEGPSEEMSEGRPETRARAEAQLEFNLPTDPHVHHDHEGRVFDADTRLAPMGGSSGWHERKNSTLPLSQLIGLPSYDNIIPVGDLPVSEEGWMRPTGGPMTSDFGPRDLDDGWHDGVDFGIPIDTEVVASNTGIVSSVVTHCDPNGGYVGNSCGGYLGNHVVISHEGGTRSYYGHLSTTSVQPGDTVEAGDTVGYGGNSGSSTGPHLHFGMRVGAGWVDPCLHIPC